MTKKIAPQKSKAKPRKATKGEQSSVKAAPSKARSALVKAAKAEPSVPVRAVRYTGLVYDLEQHAELDEAPTIDRLARSRIAARPHEIRMQQLRRAPDPEAYARENWPGPPPTKKQVESWLAEKWPEPLSDSQVASILAADKMKRDALASTASDPTVVLFEIFKHLAETARWSKARELIKRDHKPTDEWRSRNGVEVTNWGDVPESFWSPKAAADEWLRRAPDAKPEHVAKLASVSPKSFRKSLERDGNDSEMQKLIADCIGMPFETVKSRIKRAVKP